MKEGMEAEMEEGRMERREGRRVGGGGGEMEERRTKRK